MPEPSATAPPASEKVSGCAGKSASTALRLPAADAFSAPLCKAGLVNAGGVLIELVEHAEQAH
mgnify:CR=1 FL=1